MGRITFTAILVLLLASFALNVSALEAPHDLYLGDADSRASNPNADEVLQRDIFHNEGFFVTNDKEHTLALGSRFVPAPGYDANDLDVIIARHDHTLEPGQSVPIAISVRVPEYLDATDTGSWPTVFHAGDLVLTANGEEKPVDIYLQRENKLELEGIEVCVNDPNNCEGANTPGDVVESLRPGDEVIFRFLIENKYSDSEDAAFDDIELGWEIDEDNIAEDDDFSFDLEPEEREIVTSSFVIDEDVQEGLYGVDVTLYGFDEFGARHGERHTFGLEVKASRHEISIKDHQASPNTLQCANMTTTIDATLSNIGRSYEGDVVFRAVNHELDLDYKTGTFALDAGESRSVSLIVKARNAVPGEHIVRLQSFFDTQAQSDEGFVTVTVPDCSEPEQNTHELFVVLLVDTSGSAGQIVHNAQYNVTLLTKDIARMLPEHADIGLINFNSNATVQHELSPASPELFEAMDAMRYGGGTVMYPALDAAGAMLKAARGEKYIILISDGNTQLPDHAMDRAETMGSDGIKVITAGYGERRNDYVLEQIADRAGGFLVTEDYDQIEAYFSHNKTEQLICTADVKQCPDGSFVGRDSSNGCAFRECPAVTGSAIPPKFSLYGQLLRFKEGDLADVGEQEVEDIVEALPEELVKDLPEEIIEELPDDIKGIVEGRMGKLESIGESEGLDEEDLESQLDRLKEQQRSTSVLGMGYDLLRQLKT